MFKHCLVNFNKLNFYNFNVKTIMDMAKMQKWNRKTRRSKTAHMTYPCIPIWMKERFKDPFDYPLRTRKEIAFEQYLNPPLFTAKITKNEYTALSRMSTMNVNKADNRSNEVKLELKLNEMMLTPLQKKRLIFLLGPRYKNDGNVKIVCRQYTNFQHNLTKAMDIFRQLYWEAKRAPLYNWPMMKNKERRKAARKIFGKKPIEVIKQLKQEASENVQKEMKQFNEIYDNGNYNYEFIKDNIQKHLDKLSSKTEMSEEESKKRIEEAKKAEEILLKGAKEKELVRRNILSKKAYDTFFNNAEMDS